MLITTFYSCFTSNTCYNYYSFEFPMTISPSQDTFHIGDTIWCEMNLPNEILDKNSGEYIDFTDYELFYTLSMDRVDTNTLLHTPILDFDLYAETGRIDQDVNTFVYTYTYFKTINEKTFKIGLIPKQKGTFCLGYSLASYFSRIEADDTKRLEITDTKCREEMTTESGIRINNGNINYYLIDGVCQWTPDSLQICYGSYDKMAAKGAFAFVVN